MKGVPVLADRSVLREPSDLRDLQEPEDLRDLRVLQDLRETAVHLVHQDLQDPVLNTILRNCLSSCHNPDLSLLDEEDDVVKHQKWLKDQIPTQLFLTMTTKSSAKDSKRFSLLSNLSNSSCRTSRNRWVEPRTILAEVVTIYG